MRRAIQNPTIRIIDNKKVWMTPDEYKYYEEICLGYDRPNFQGKDLFQDHFESNDSGIIVFVKPPHKKYSSMEVFTFLVSVQVNQQLRLAREQVDALVKEAENKLRETLDESVNLKEELKSLKEEVERLKEMPVKGNSKKERKTDDGTGTD
jgi:hypothetical protein